MRVHTYSDPLDVIWTQLAGHLGWRIERSTEVYAAWDGHGTLTLASSDTFDPDDSLAQMIFHEICHALVEGQERWSQPDWGLCNTDARDLAQEWAAVRVQAALADAHGLRKFLAPTTDHRA